MATDLQRTHLLGLMKWMVENEPLIDYVQRRPMSTIGYHEVDLSNMFLHKLHIAIDCSESVTILCKLAGLKDPNGLGYNGSGYTGTLLSHLLHYTDPAHAKVGALVVFGPNAGEHVCMVVVPGEDPMLFSHGQNAGPILIRLSDERRAHHPPVTFLDIGGL